MIIQSQIRLSLLVLGFVAASLCAFRTPGAPPLKECHRLVVEGLGATALEEPASALGAGIRASRWWSGGSGQVTERLAEHVLTKAVSPAKWLKRWRSAHGCTATVLEGFSRLPIPAPQLTFEGTCEGGDSYVIHLVQLGQVMYELHTDGRVFSASTTKLREAMRGLMARAHCAAEVSTGTGPG